MERALIVRSNTSVPPPKDAPTIVLATTSQARTLLGDNFEAPLPATAASGGGYTVTVPSETPSAVHIVGSSSQHVLYGCYEYLTRLGLTFTSAGVTVPAPSQVRTLPAGFKVSDAPVFTTRGLQPFHDFAEGPDWWCVRVLELLQR